MRILAVANMENPKAVAGVEQLRAFTELKGIDCFALNAFDAPLPVELSRDVDAFGNLEKVGVKGNFDMVVSMGGDGTTLCAARVANVFDAPVLGINYGHLGFLENPASHGVVTLVEAALNGDVTEERRANLSIEAVCMGDDECPEDQKGPRHFFALNEATLTRGSSPRIFPTKVEISGSTVCTMRGDGLIVATPTGSTAYALSAGGPLCSPERSGMVIVPLATHTLQSRAIVTAGHDVVEITFPSEYPIDFVEMQLDGTSVSLERPIERVIFRRGNTRTKLLFYQKESFYDRIARIFFYDENRPKAWD